MQKCEKKSDAEAWNKVFYESNVNTLVIVVSGFISQGKKGKISNASVIKSLITKSLRNDSNLVVINLSHA